MQGEMGKWHKRKPIQTEKMQVEQATRLKMQAKQATRLKMQAEQGTILII
jgi:hypothetical protein